jgi:NADP-dependent 3-hydroxy acid dehydrogenase YdfG
MKSFKGKVVWITGASSGIGRELAQAYSNEGAFVIISARRKELLEEVKSSVKEPSNCMVLPLDLNEHSKALNWVKEAFHLKAKSTFLLIMAVLVTLGPWKKWTLR